MEAIVYIAHGSRRIAANQEFCTFIQSVIRNISTPIQTYGFLEHAAPTVIQAIEAVIDKGATDITLVPIFLLPGIHVNEDIPDISACFPGVNFHYGKPLGADNILLDILQERLIEAGFQGWESEAVLLVGHGSRTAGANTQFCKLTNSLAEKISRPIHSASITRAELYQHTASRLKTQKVYILPHFLFSGSYITKMQTELSMIEGKFIFCRPIGFDLKLLPLIEKRILEVS
ncbi:sirohydrochlorin chelatase [Bacillus rubiinfantis]|uniref:sirohydrochlorin chelatase n=1 Tax=Bacillus rubiinfantis TaxID=1499680 RepID=UPI000693BEBD|nr:sirohydrochlorin chelatase [Bacillus rubiinfantis]